MKVCRIILNQRLHCFAIACDSNVAEEAEAPGLSLLLHYSSQSAACTLRHAHQATSTVLITLANE